MIGMTILLLAPAISRRCKLPDAVGLILAGIIFGPALTEIFSKKIKSENGLSDEAKENA